ncbi:hypothetical protein K493DRAFT_408430, partial [Basidiobolus meristosporus CBS 931.73]
MISNVTGIDQILGNITSLDLSYNRLKSLCGLHKLWALVLINVRGNDIADAGEIGRLAELPSLQEVFVEGNPLTQKADYRVQIFSIFFSHELDILLDGTGPSFLEKRGITSEPKGEPEVDSIMAVRSPEAYVPPASNGSAASEKMDSNEIPSLKPRRKGAAPNKSKRKGKRIVDISSGQDPLDSIAESPRLLTASLSRNFSEDIMTDEPEGMIGESNAHPQSQPDSQNPSSGEAATKKSPLQRATSPGRLGRPFVHRLAELEGTIQTNRSEFRIPTRGRSIQRDSQPSSPRSRSPTSIRSSMSAVTATNNSDDFRKKIEALRNEAGSTWLKIYSEIQHPTNAARRRSVIDSPDPEDDKFVVGSLPSKLTLVSLRKPEPKAIDPMNEGEPIDDEVRSASSPSSANSIANNDKLESISPILESTELPVSEEVIEAEPEIDTKKLPDGKQYRIQVAEYSSRTRSKRCIRIPMGDRILIITDTAFVEVHPDTWDIATQRGFQGLLRIEAKRVEKPEQHTLFRLEFKYRRYDNPIFCDYKITSTPEHLKASEELQNELETILRKNWQEGRGHEVYKQGKCLNCSWIGFLDLEDDKDNDWLKVKKLNNSLSPVTSESENDTKEKERKCPVCAGTFLVEFFGQENGVTLSNEPPTWAFTSSSHVTDSESPASNKLGFFDSWLANPLVGLANRIDAKSPVKSRILSPTSAQDTKELKKKKSEINEAEILKTVEQVAGYVASLPPYRGLTNAIRLHFQLTILEDDDEKLITWVSSSFIPHAPTSVAVPSMWSIMSSNIEHVPKSAPVEKPVYIGLTNKT